MYGAVSPQSNGKGLTHVADTLKASLLDTDRRGAVVADLQNFVDQEVAGKGGLSDNDFICAAKVDAMYEQRAKA